MSQTIDRALGLLRHFTEASPSLGLSEVTRLCGLDKATTYRLLSSLTKNGLLEQDVRSKNYMLGATLLNFARIRELSFPLSSIVESELQALSDITGETAHVTWLTPAGLAPIAVVESKKANRVSAGISTPLPFHATASGHVVLAFSTASFRESRLKPPFPAATTRTPASKTEVLKLVLEAERRGFAVADQTFEDEVVGISAPIFGNTGYAEGAIAVVVPSHRATQSMTRDIAAATVASAIRLTMKRGNVLPETYQRFGDRQKK